MEGNRDALRGVYFSHGIVPLIGGRTTNQTASLSDLSMLSCQGREQVLDGLISEATTRDGCAALASRTSSRCYARRIRHSPSDPFGAELKLSYVRLVPWTVTPSMGGGGGCEKQTPLEGLVIMRYNP